MTTLSTIDVASLICRTLCPSRPIAIGEIIHRSSIALGHGLLVGGNKLSSALETLGLIDEYHLVVHPILAGHGPTLFHGLERWRRLALVSTHRLKSGVMALHYRRHEE
jgi:dihydrofolate reductase